MALPRSAVTIVRLGLFLSPSITSLLVLKHRILIDVDLEMAKCFGGGLKGHALSMHFARNIKPNSVLIRQALDRGEDPLKTVSLGEKGQGLLFLLNCSIAYNTFSFCSGAAY